MHMCKDDRCNCRANRRRMLRDEGLLGKAIICINDHEPTAMKRKVGGHVCPRCGDHA